MNPLAIFSILRASWVWIVIGVLLLALGLQTVRLDHERAAAAQLQAEYAEEREKAADAAQQAEQAAREVEQDREQRKQEIIDEAEHETERAKASAAAAVASADGLRKQLAVFVANAHQAASDPGAAKGSAGQSGSDPLDVLANLYAKSDDRAGQVSLYADALRIAGLACEAEADSLK